VIVTYRDFQLFHRERRRRSREWRYLCRMNPIVEERRDELAAICRRFGVRRLELFGSAATDGFDSERSDLDFLVEFDPDPNRRADRYFGLLEALEELFGRPVDVVEIGAIRNPYFLTAIEASRTLLHAA
jgi:hypothetical protein